MPIHRARTAQNLAIRAIAARGLAHPITLALLAVAATTASRAWDIGHRVTDTHPPAPNGTLVPDDLYERYMTAHRALAAHRTGCTACRSRQTCQPAQRLVESFTRLQDAYLARQKQKRG
ncbi:hypothetical protein HRW18_24975 [Streptomyces lunaelactis]|uniref:hypothetical protein n=1 Tax=Streptomyces lunaelactis TaxID=1535768 RepID=UPI00158596A6|nr:hypothetical protein [Streptomyces lunaelactis]NUK11172.1 hypothetical protein [Streptomyces lunaelactis]NUK74665.1 hypothetical protein [Streptomyces lunaelactis]NUL13216.1 hypothetical protein [Streptomyces lunaelactis]NUL26230.1 hypothetical protein [Streptomyces lunaelactis]